MRLDLPTRDDDNKKLQSEHPIQMMILEGGTAVPTVMRVHLRTDEAFQEFLICDRKSRGMSS